VERISVFIVEAFDTGNAVIHEHAEKKEEETAELKVRPVTPDLTIVRIGTNNDVEDEEVGNPDASATETFKDSTKNSRSVASNEHTKEVITKDNSSIKNTEAKDLAVVEEHVKGIKSILTTILLGDVRSEAKEDRANDGTPHTLKTDNENRVKNDLLKEVFLNDDLRSLDNLSDNYESTAKSSLSSGGLLIRRRRSLRAILRETRSIKGSESDNDKSESDNTNTNPVRSVEIALKE